MKFYSVGLLFISAILILTNCNEENSIVGAIFKGYVIDIETKLPIDAGKVCIHQFESVGLSPNEDRYIGSTYDTVELSNGYYFKLIEFSQTKPYYRIVPIKEGYREVLNWFYPPTKDVTPFPMQSNIDSVYLSSMAHARINVPQPELMDTLYLSVPYNNFAPYRWYFYYNTKFISATTLVLDFTYHNNKDIKVTYRLASQLEETIIEADLIPLDTIEINLEY